MSSSLPSSQSAAATAQPNFPPLPLQTASCLTPEQSNVLSRLPLFIKPIFADGLLKHIKSLENRCTDLNKQIQELSTAFVKNEPQLRAEVTAIEAKMDAIQTKLHKQETLLNGTRRLYEDNQMDFDETEQPTYKTILALNVELNSLGEQKDDLKLRLSQLNGPMAQLQREKSTLDQEFKTTEAIYRTLQPKTVQWAEALENDVPKYGEKRAHEEDEEESDTELAPFHLNKKPRSEEDSSAAAPPLSPMLMSARISTGAAQATLTSASSSSSQIPSPFLPLQLPSASSSSSSAAQKPTPTKPVMMDVDTSTLLPASSQAAAPKQRPPQFSLRQGLLPLPQLTNPPYPQVAEKRSGTQSPSSSAASTSSKASRQNSPPSAAARMEVEEVFVPRPPSYYETQQYPLPRNPQNLINLIRPITSMETLPGAFIGIRNPNKAILGIDTGANLFHYLARLGNFEILDKMLLPNHGQPKKADIFSQLTKEYFTKTTPEGLNVLHIFAMKHTLRLNKDQIREVVALMLKNGIDVNAVDRQGNPPIYYATEELNSDVVAVLLEFGASPMICNHKSFSPFHLLVGTVYADNESRLIARTIMKEFIMHSSEVVNFATDKTCFSPLMLACSSGNEWAVNLLLKKKANTDLVDSDGHTARYYAEHPRIDETVNAEKRKRLKDNIDDHASRMKS